ncbi:MAG: hypothetical protein Q4D37_08095 [Oscillospiraceae bacterium]|nr:hypothetical protein [Oscillospiraceae bacterium]
MVKRIPLGGKGDFPLRWKMSTTLTKRLGKNVGAADKGKGHPLKKGQLSPAKHCKLESENERGINDPLFALRKNKTV